MALLSRRRSGSEAPALRGPGRSRPVMLVTLGVPFDAQASAFAVESAVEAGQPLLVVNVVDLPLAPAAVAFGYDSVEDPAELAEALLAPVALAASLGVEVERLRVKSPHRVAALLEIVAERRPGLLVFGPDRELLQRRLYRRAERAVRERTSCLVWIP
jgi:universal stress protein family protein